MRQFTAPPFGNLIFTVVGTCELAIDCSCCVSIVPEVPFYC